MPGLNSEVMNLNGPEPMYSLIGSDGGVSATRFGIMNGANVLDLPSAFSTSPVGSLSTMRNVFWSTIGKLSTMVIRIWASLSWAIHRLIDVVQSSDVTGAPS